MKKFILGLAFTLSMVSCGPGLSLEASPEAPKNPPANTNTTVPGSFGSWTPSWNSVVAYWSLNETAAGTVVGGADIADGSPSGTRHGTQSGTVTYGVPGKIGSAMSFSNSGCFTIPGDSGTNLSTLTAMAWVKTNSGLIGNLLSFYKAASGNEGWALLVNNVVGKGSFWGGNANGFIDTTSTVLNDGSWHHFAAVATTNTLKLYVDGVLDSTTAISAIPPYTGPVVIGADGDCLQKLTGDLDEIAVWNGALSDADILAIYHYQSTH